MERKTIYSTNSSATLPAFFTNIPQSLNDAAAIKYGRKDPELAESFFQSR